MFLWNEKKNRRGLNPGRSLQGTLPPAPQPQRKNNPSVITKEWEELKRKMQTDEDKFIFFRRISQPKKILSEIAVEI